MNIKRRSLLRSLLLGTAMAFPVARIAVKEPELEIPEWDITWRFDGHGEANSPYSLIDPSEFAMHFAKNLQDATGREVYIQTVGGA